MKCLRKLTIEENYLLRPPPPDEEPDDDPDEEPDEEPDEYEPPEEPDDPLLYDEEDLPPEYEELLLLFEPEEKLDPLSALLLVGTEYDPEFPEGETTLRSVLPKPGELFL